MEPALFVTAGALGWAAFERMFFNRRKSGYRTNGSTVPPVTKLPPPNPSWSPDNGEKQCAPYNQLFLDLDPEILGHQLYPFMISGIVPRPIALLSSLSKEGIPNLAPYSFFNIMSCDPPYVAIGALTTRSRPDKGWKDSQQNIVDTGEFVVNLISYWYLEAANITCGDFKHNESEFEAANLTPLPSQKVKAPRVAESAVHLECKLRHTYPVKNKQGRQHAAILIGEVVMIHANQGVLEKDPKGRHIVNLEKLAPVSRLGDLRYALTVATIEMEMPMHEFAGNVEASSAREASRGP